MLLNDNINKRKEHLLNLKSTHIPRLKLFKLYKCFGPFKDSKRDDIEEDIYFKEGIYML